MTKKELAKRRATMKEDVQRLGWMLYLRDQELARLRAEMEAKKRKDSRILSELEG